MFMTICIPSFNRAYILERTLDSLVQQTDHDFETLLIDDGSTDNTAEVVKKYVDTCNLKYYKKVGGGKHTALNLGIEKAQGEYFMILDSDDWLAKCYIEKIKRIVSSIDYKQSGIPLCGVIGKCQNTDGKVLGQFFGQTYISYIDFHFRNKSKPYGDCCECIKTSIIKKYRWPEPVNTRFVPEAYVFDQIGVDYALYCSNDIFKYIEYMEDGITQNVLEHQDKNNIGYLYNYVSKLDDIFPRCNKIPIKKRASYWRLYWKAVRKDKLNEGPRVKKVDFLGYIVWIISRLL